MDSSTFWNIAGNSLFLTMHLAPSAWSSVSPFSENRVCLLAEKMCSLLNIAAERYYRTSYSRLGNLISRFCNMIDTIEARLHNFFG